MVAESAEEIRGEFIYGPPKTYARRRVELPGGLADELAEHLAGRGGDLDALSSLPPTADRSATPTSRAPLQLAVRRSGFHPATAAHDLRHTAAAGSFHRGRAHLLVVKERLGHSTIAVTADRYGHLFPSLEAAARGQGSRLRRAHVIELRLRRHRGPRRSHPVRAALGIMSSTTTVPPMVSMSTMACGGSNTPSKNTRSVVPW